MKHDSAGSDYWRRANRSRRRLQPPGTWQKPVVLEAGEGPGHTIRQWAHVSTFSPWEFMTDRAAVRMLEAHGWRPAAAVPSGRKSDRIVS